MSGRKTAVALFNTGVFLMIEIQKMDVF